MFFAIIILLFGAGLYYAVIKPYLGLKFYEKQGLMCAFGVPLLGTIATALANVQKHKDLFYRLKNFSDICPVFPKANCTVFLGYPSVVIIEPKLIGEFLRNQDKYKKFQFGLEITLDAMGASLVFQEGKEWSRDRKWISPVFHFDIITNYINIINQTTADVMTANLRKLGKDYNFFQLLTDVTGNACLEVFLGKAIRAQQINNKSANQYLDGLQKQIVKTTFSPINLFTGFKAYKWGIGKANKQMKKDGQNMKAQLIKLIENEKERILANQCSEQTVLSIMMKHNLLKTQADLLTLVDNTLGFYFAGKETTAGFLEMVVYYLAKYPEHQQILREEVKNIGKIDQSSLKEMKLTDNFFKEVQRHFGPTTLLLNRQAIEDHKIGDIYIKKDSIVNAGFVYNHNNPEYFQNPREFNPDRWSAVAKDKKYLDEAFIFCPFSAGQRNCIGQHVANIISKVFIIHLLKETRNFKLVDNFELVLGIKRGFYSSTNPLGLIIEFDQTESIQC